MRGSRTKSLRRATGNLRPGRKHGGCVTEPASTYIGVDATRYHGPTLKNDGHDADRIFNAERKRQRRMIRNRMLALR